MASTPTQRIPILDLTPEIEHLWPELSAALERTIRSGQFILGPETKAFENEVADWLGAKHAIGVNSGTDALVIGLRALGIGPGDEVITTPFSFFATAESISNVGAKPVFVDVELNSMNLDVDLIESAITERTKAIMPVHLFGRPCRMGKLMEIARKHNLKVIEDCAQSFGAAYRPPCVECESCDPVVRDEILGKMTGTIGDVGCFSFFPTKNLGCYGDGGLITTNDDAIADQCRMLRAHGSKKKYHNEILGYNSRLDSVQAAILRVKLPHIQAYNDARRTIAGRYRDLLADVEGVITPEVVDGHVFHQYTVRITKGDRDEVQQRLDEMGISTMLYYPVPQDRLPVYLGQYPTYPTNEQLSREVLSLPIWPQLDETTQLHIADCVRKALA